MDILCLLKLNIIFYVQIYDMDLISVNVLFISLFLKTRAFLVTKQLFLWMNYNLVCHFIWKQLSYF